MHALVCVDVSVTAGTAETASFFITMRHLRGVVEAHDGIQLTAYSARMAPRVNFGGR